VTPAARSVLLSRGVSAQYGARELKRTIHRLLTQPLAALVASGQIVPGTRVVADAGLDNEALVLKPLDEPATTMPAVRAQPVVLLLDDNNALLGWLEAVLRGAGFETISSGTAAQAREAIASRRPDVAVLDVVVPDGDGVSLAMELRSTEPKMQLLLMTGMELSPDEAALCERYDIPVLRKPFLGQDAISLIQSRLVHTHAGRGAPIAGPDRA
jgi:CheY-like chemotaxis protein